LLFRPRDNARRFRRSAARLALEPFPEDTFVSAVEELVRRNRRFVPPHGRGSFYVRPLEHAIEPRLGLSPPAEFWVLMFGSPVGSYVSRAGGVRLKALEQSRVTVGGTGAAKTIGNYAGGIAIQAEWKRRDFDDVLYLDARHLRYVTETSGSNVFARLRDGKLVTPALDDQILAGVTRDSVIRLARETLGVEVEERPLALAEVLEEADEVFCAGTAWTLQPVRMIDWQGEARHFESDELQRTLLAELHGIQCGEREDRFGWVVEIGPA
jgi:branched-chain amino acid aminotransferase